MRRGSSLNTHEQYEELCALAASGQASQGELDDLRSHLETCPNCRSAAYDFNRISAQGLSSLAAKRLHCKIPSGMTQRFLARARSEGIELSRDNLPSAVPPDRRVLFTSIAVAAALIVVVSVLIVAKQKASTTASRVSLPVQETTVPSLRAEDQNRPIDDARLGQKLSSAQAEVTSMKDTIQSQRTELESARQATNDLDSRLKDAEQRSALSTAERSQREARIAELEAELEKARSDKNASDTAVTLEEAEVRELQKQLSDDAVALRQQQELAERGSDVRDLVVARNLHIIDVHDRDGNGKSQRAFGRIFYTEGKSLIFYAYDLADPRKLEAKVSFYVWGERLGAEKPIRSLGVFRNDDANDGRWVLTFDDPQVLAQINSVFVTVESSKKVIKEPGGRRVLFAFLGDKPNHP
jgi:hypothetical protein